ncbi:MAG: hypothetical protein ACOH2F_06825 [Cellulomonas sp.]
MAAVKVGDDLAESVAQARRKDNWDSRLRRCGGFGPLWRTCCIERRGRPTPPCEGRSYEPGVHLGVLWIAKPRIGRCRDSLGEERSLNIHANTPPRAGNHVDRSGAAANELRYEHLDRLSSIIDATFAATHRPLVSTVQIAAGHTSREHVKRECKQEE